MAATAVVMEGNGVAVTSTPATLFTRTSANLDASGLHVLNVSGSANECQVRITFKKHGKTSPDGYVTGWKYVRSGGEKLWLFRKNRIEKIEVQSSGTCTIDWDLVDVEG